MRKALAPAMRGFLTGAGRGAAIARGRLGTFYAAGVRGGAGVLPAVAPVVAAPAAGAEEVAKRDLERRLGLDLTPDETRDRFREYARICKMSSSSQRRRISSSPQKRH